MTNRGIGTWVAVSWRLVVPEPALIDTNEEKKLIRREKGQKEKLA